MMVKVSSRPVFLPYFLPVLQIRPANRAREAARMPKLVQNAGLKFDRDPALEQQRVPVAARDLIESDGGRH